MIFSGSMGMLDLEDLHAADKLNPGRVAKCISSVSSFNDVGSLPGTVICNVQLCTVDGDTVRKLKLAHKEAEITAMCLIAYWLKDDKSAALALADVCTDLVLDGRFLGAGSKFNSQRLSLIEAEEADREVIGSSAYRMTMFLVACAAQIDTEKRFPNLRSLGERLAAALAEDKVAGAASKYNAETCKRYLTLGQRLNTPDIAGRPPMHVSCGWLLSF